MNAKELVFVKGALAALSQNATFPADVEYAKNCLQMALLEDPTLHGYAPEDLRLADDGTLVAGA